jgi:hypothetical protein
MAEIKPEVTGRKSGSGIAAVENWIELQRIISLKEAARYCGLSVDTIKRRHADKIIELSPRRRGMRVRDSLMLK